jgi:hypothetical protein
MAKAKKAAAGAARKTASKSSSRSIAAAKTSVQKKITIELTEDQLEAFAKQYGKLDPSKAVELVFRSANAKRATSKLKIAGYSYHGSTCCA